MKTNFTKFLMAFALLFFGYVGQTQTSECENDTEAPVAICKSDVIVALDASGQATLSPMDVDDGSTDNCGIASMTITTSEFGCNTATYALDLDGSNDYLEMPTGIVNGLTNFTFETWVDYTDSGFWNRIFDIGNNEFVNMFLTAKANRSPNVGRPRLGITVDGIIGEQVIDSNIAMPSGWTHIAVTMEEISEGNVVGKMFINGVLVGENNGMTLTPNDLGNTVQNLLGKSQYPDPYLNGKLDEVRIWSVARTQTQIQAALNIALSGDEFGLFAYYNFEDGPGSAVATDSSSSNNDATLINMDINTDWVTPGVVNTLGIGSHPITLTVTDNNGNIDTCTTTVTVVDEIAPTVSCTNFTAVLNSSGTVEIDVLDVLDTYDDNCEVQSIALSENTFTCDNLGDNTVTVTVTDVSGNSVTCNATVTVVDNEAPIIVDTTTPDVEAECSVTLTAPTAQDNCAGEITGTTEDPLEYTEIGEYLVNWSFDDGNGNVSTTTQNIIVSEGVNCSTDPCDNDTEAPVISNPVVIGSLLASYPLTNNLNDEIGNNSNMFSAGLNAPLTPSDPNGICVEGNFFTGGNYVSTPQIAGFDSTEFSVKVDFNISDYGSPTNTGGNPIIIGSFSFRFIGIEVNSTTGAVGLIWNNGDFSYSNTTLNLSEWYTAEIKFLNDTAELYINGSLVHTVVTGPLNTGGNSDFSTNNGGNRGGFTGCIKNLEISSDISNIKLQDAVGECNVTLTAPTAQDNCAGEITGTTEDPLEYTEIGEYLVNWSFDDGNGNVSTTTQNIIVSEGVDCSALSVVDFNVANIYVGPNPMGAVLTIELNNTANLLNISLFDLTGKKVLSSTTNIVSVDALEKGIYIVKITTDKGSFIKKLVKN